MSQTHTVFRRVQELVEILGNLAWVIVGLIAAALLGWQLLRYLQPHSMKGSSAGM